MFESSIIAHFSPAHEKTMMIHKLHISSAGFALTVNHPSEERKAARNAQKLRIHFLHIQLMIPTLPPSINHYIERTEMDDIHFFSRRLEEGPSPRSGKRSSSNRKFKPTSRRRKPRSNSDDDQSDDQQGRDNRHSHNSVIFRYGLAFTFLLCAVSIILTILAFASSNPNNIHSSILQTD
jgi:hypothetical protein